jgi:polyisoprenyl-phosphate glycosyltransferase
MRRSIVDILNQMPEQHRFLRGMVSWIGGRQVPYVYNRQARYAGATGYPLKKMIRFSVDAITSFSIIPLRFAMWLGFIASLIAFMLLLYAIVGKIGGHNVPGWTSSVVIVSFFSGVQLLVLGVMGEYLGRSVEMVVLYSRNLERIHMSY